MDVKTSFLNGELDEEVYMNQPYGFIITGNENKACKLIKCLYGLKQAPKQCHQKFDKVDLTKEFLSSRFSMKDIGEADVIVGIRIKHESNRIAIYESHYIEKGDWLLDPGNSSLVLEGYNDARWISNTEDNSSTSYWIFLLGELAGKEAQNGVSDIGEGL
ncbi:zinc finger, CCHC-type containing protein [Tanacetum coccineum]